MVRFPGLPVSDFFDLITAYVDYSLHLPSTSFTIYHKSVRNYEVWPERVLQTKMATVLIYDCQFQKSATNYIMVNGLMVTFHSPADTFKDTEGFPRIIYSRFPMIYSVSHSKFG